MTRLLVFFAVIVVMFALLRAPSPPPQPEVDPAVCAGPPLRTPQAREDAMEKGYMIDRRYDCIERQSWEAVNAQQQAWEKQRAQTLASERKRLAEAGHTTFAQARHGFETTVAIHDEHSIPLPQPPARLFVRSDYKNPQNYMLPGFVSPDPGDGQRHPAIIWLTGGDSNSLSDFWTPGPDQNDQSARAFREAGLIMAFPTLRGGNGQRSPKQAMLGEVDDVLAAAAQLARLSYVDPERIYLGGHSTGATLALLTAEMKTPFKAVFALGPVTRVERYPASLLGVDFAQLAPMESKLRSPIHWLDGIAQPTYVIEGSEPPGNATELDALCAASRNPMLHCIRVPGADHFSAIRPVTRLIAGKLATDSNEALSLQPEEFLP
ncbi:MAG: prolyl oligopeptidase family serine peptidase [Xanthomonadaceae bacterium]|nr:prolyl oligopeptidase family serine peptidase [Xanthomonadaceae bacterium]